MNKKYIVLETNKHENKDFYSQFFQDEEFQSFDSVEEAEMAIEKELKASWEEGSLEPDVTFNLVIFEKVLEKSATLIVDPEVEIRDHKK